MQLLAGLIELWVVLGTACVVSYDLIDIKSRKGLMESSSECVIHPKLLKLSGNKSLVQYYEKAFATQRDSFIRSAPPMCAFCIKKSSVSIVNLQLVCMT